MRTNRFVLVSAALWFTATAATFAASAHLGTWKLNESKSTFASGMTKNQTVTYTEAEGDMMKLTVDGTDKDGKPLHWTWTGKFDGKQYKVEGSPIIDTVAYKALNDHTNSATGMKDGKVVFTGTIKVAKDGKSRMVTTTMADANGKKHTDKAYYDKQ
jgi:ribosomal protein S11